MVRFFAACIAVVIGIVPVVVGTAWSAGGPGALLYDMVKQAMFTTPTTGAITLSGAISGFQTLTAAGGASGQLLSYSIIDTPTGWEVGRGTFLTSASGATFTRTPIWSSNSNNAISASINAVIAVSALAEDMLIGETTGSLAQRFGTTPQQFAVYNTSDTGTALPTNYERGVISWTSPANILLIGTQKGGNGVSRAMQLASNQIGFYENTSGGILTFGSAALFGGHAQIQLGGQGNGWSNVFIANSRELLFTDGASTDTALANAGVLSTLFFNSAGDTLGKGFYAYGGTARVTADQTYTTTTTLANVPGLSVTLVSGRTYSVEADVYFNETAGTGGIQLALSGTLGTSAVNYSGWIEDFPANGIKGGTTATSMGTAVANSATSGTTGHAKISGLVAVNGAGTLTVQAAQQVSSGTTTVTRGSKLIVIDTQ